MLTVRQTHATLLEDRVVQGLSIHRDGALVHVRQAGDERHAETFDLNDGDVFVMNERGSTVATYRRLAAPVVVSPVDDGFRPPNELDDLKPARDIADGAFPVY